MELQDINNFVQTANEEQLKAFGFLGQWMMENVPKHCNCPSKCNQNCELAKALGGALQAAGQRLQGQ
ncbi:MAG: hypothetical protein PHF18_02560 [Methanosarcina sp.]|uniref:hypothetical protein n=1 Tax=Methanosarcina sp. TaxID=2213 RepID=UPI002635A92A|nr:hypothetical protein [Methanosarcina sp.]MDD3245741.1 hypothetical protein [Methanosarcina sp.]MDD4248715.1 hypothetical protein [Methanosarcina sp.]